MHDAMILYVLLRFFLAIVAQTNPMMNLKMNVKGALVIYIGFSKSKISEPIPEASPPPTGPSMSAESKQKALPKCIMVL